MLDIGDRVETPEGKLAGKVVAYGPLRYKMEKGRKKLVFGWVLENPRTGKRVTQVNKMHPDGKYLQCKDCSPYHIFNRDREDVGSNKVWCP